MIFVKFATNTQMTLNFDLDLDTDLVKRCLSYVSIIILCIITGINPFFLYEFSKFRNDLDL
jgi:hypothetical protein